MHDESTSFRNARVLVVGASPAMADVAAWLSELGAKTTLSVHPHDYGAGSCTTAAPDRPAFDLVVGEWGDGPEGPGLVAVSKLRDGSTKAPSLDFVVSAPLSASAVAMAVARWLAAPTSDSREETSADTPPVTIAEFAEVLGVNPQTDRQIVFDFLSVFLSQSQIRLKSIARAIAETNGEWLACEAHGLKGSCAILGLNRLTEFCAELERHGLHAVFDDAPQTLRRLERAHARVCRYLEAFVASARGNDSPNG